MSLEKFFCSESSTFQFALWVLFMVLYGVSRAVWWRFSVKFNVAKREV